ncbi:ASF1 [Ecytonucleospora hepatopenaei]|uniref:Anti-silencing function protein 1 n=1 Tax=Ecytonucleospora hepatopenaei TaxID=646526 RepID=A0A1W0E434_9MICR|nr:ASF1 [Ecytonucleospora hepatopenaei]
MKKEEGNSIEKEENISNEETYSEEYEEGINNPFEISEIEFDTTKVYKYNDILDFKIKLKAHEEIKDDILVKIVYFGTYGTVEDEQVLGSAVVGPFTEGEFEVDVTSETGIALHKIPIKSLFGLSTVMLSFSLNGYELVRYAFIVNVEYPGIKQENLVCEEAAEDLNEEESEEESVLDSRDSADMVDVAEESEEAKEDSENKEHKNKTEPEEEKTEGDEDSLGNSFTPIKESESEFTWKEKTFDKNKIEFKFMARPIVHVFDAPVETVEETAKKMKVE